MTKNIDNTYNEILNEPIRNMVLAVIIIPLSVVAIAGIIGYVVYRFGIKDYVCNKSVNDTLREFKIKKTQYQIIKEYHENKGEKISDKEIAHLQKHYRQHEPEQFLAMYDSIREKSDTEKESK